MRRVKPRAFYAALAPRGLIDPREGAAQAGSPLRPPFPAIAFASGRRTIPYLRHLKRLSPRTFTVFLKDPRIGAQAADAVWVAEHDALRGPNVIVSETAPHVVTAQALSQARAAPDPRVGSLPAPRVALLLGGPGRHHPFGHGDEMRVQDAALTVLAQGMSLMVTASRRTPPAFVAKLRAMFAEAGVANRTFVWAGDGENPYLSMLALADAVIVTQDSTNMVGEAIATAAPVHILPLARGHPRQDAFIEGLVQSGRVRFWRGALETWPVMPVDSTAEVAAEITRRFEAFQQALPQR